MDGSTGNYPAGRSGATGNMIAGIVLILWGIGWALGAASLGGNAGAYLVYSPVMIVASIAFTLFGGYLLFRAGVSRGMRTTGGI